MMSRPPHMLYFSRPFIGAHLCYFLSPVVANPNKGKYKEKENLQHIITQND